MNTFLLLKKRSFLHDETAIRTSSTYFPRVICIERVAVAIVVCAKVIKLIGFTLDAIVEARDEHSLHWVAEGFLLSAIQRGVGGGVCF